MYSNLVTLARVRGWHLHGHRQHAHRITIAIQDRHVRISASSSTDGLHTLEIRVEMPQPGLPRFRVTREGFGSFIAGALGGQDIQVGVPSFDYEYRVRSPEPHELLRVWTPQRCQLAREQLTGMVAHATHQRLVLEVYRNDVDPPGLDDAAIIDALHLALDLAHADVYGLAVLRELPDAVFGQLDGPHVQLDGPAPIVIRPVREKDRVFTRASMAGTVPEPAPSTAALGAELASDGEVVTLSWPGIEEDPARLVAAVELLRTLTSAPRDGAYR